MSPNAFAPRVSFPAPAYRPVPSRKPFVCNTSRSSPGLINKVSPTDQAVVGTEVVDEVRRRIFLALSNSKLRYIGGPQRIAIETSIERPEHEIRSLAEPNLT